MNRDDDHPRNPTLAAPKPVSAGLNDAIGVETSLVSTSPGLPGNHLKRGPSDTHAAPSQGKLASLQSLARPGDLGALISSHEIPKRALRLGDIIHDRYRLESVLGKGGAGTVYRATQLNLGRDVAIKLMNPDVAEDDENTHRFIREARVNARLQHAHAVQIHDFGSWGDRLFIVMDLLHGKPLRHHIGRDSLTQERALTIGRQILSVLAKAHSLGLIHRDLKPENVMLSRDEDGTDHAVVVDFGLAYIIDDAELGRMTHTGVLMGTPQYLSPEQAQGLPLDASTDLYAFGCMLFEMLCGSPPFISSRIMEMINSHIFMPPPSLRTSYPELELPHALDQLCLDLLSKDPSRRPNALQALAILEALNNPTVAPEDNQDARGRSRTDRDLGSRDARAPTLRPGQRSTGRQRAAVDPLAADTQRVACVNYTASTDLHIALGVHALRAVACTPDTIPPNAAVIFAPGALSDDIKALTAHKLPIVSSAAPADFKRVTTLLRAGAKEVVAEPIDPQEVARKVKRALRKRRGR